MGHGQSPHHCRRSCLGPARKLVVKLAGALPCFPERPGGLFFVVEDDQLHTGLSALMLGETAARLQEARGPAHHTCMNLYIYILVVDIDMFVSLSLSRMRDIDAPARLASVWSQPSSTRVLLAILGRLTMSGGTSVARSLLSDSCN